jgi:endonuclease/exonuclease/phosphatase family metal-dependent hydrolase
VILIGDFNARTGKLEDFISTDGNRHIQNLVQDDLDQTKRENFDNTVNSHGKHLLELCKNCDLRILNGRTKGDSLGEPTFHSKNGISTIDYVICDINLLKYIKFLVVKPPNYFSDHSQITFWIEMKDNTAKIFQDTPNTNFSKILPPQFIWENISDRIYTESLKLPDIQMKFQVPYK